jgi:glycosyltransferase involved in cell wall biosynthesis
MAGLKPMTEKPTVLHYTGYTADGGGILRVIRTMAPVAAFRSILGVGPGFASPRSPGLAQWRGPAIAGEAINPGSLVAALAVAWRVRRWLRRGRHRIFHGHSRAGLLVGCWLALLGQSRVAVTVHCYSRQRWFYRGCRLLLGRRLAWLSPAMPVHYGLARADWCDCLPDCVPASAVTSVTALPGKHRTTFGCVGGLNPVKNWELVMQALGRIPPEVALQVVHIGPEGDQAESRDYARDLRQLGDSLALGTRWEWRGEEIEVARIHAGVDCLIVASSLEAFSVAALEAVAAGVPVLAPTGSGTTDLIRRCDGGWIFDGGSVDALAARMTALATGTELGAWRRDEAGLQTFTDRAVADRHAAFYCGLLQP